MAVLLGVRDAAMDTLWDVSPGRGDTTICKHPSGLEVWIFLNNVRINVLYRGGQHPPLHLLKPIDTALQGLGYRIIRDLNGLDWWVRQYGFTPAPPGKTSWQHYEGYRDRHLTDPGRLP